MTFSNKTETDIAEKQCPFLRKKEMRKWQKLDYAYALSAIVF